MFYKESRLKSQVQIGRDTNADRSWEIEDTIDILEAQIESLELELCYKNHKLEEMEQELRYTNQELCTISNSEQLTFEQAEELAIKFLATEKPLKDALVELLIAIYNVPVKLDKLAQVPRGCFTNRWDEIESEDAA